MPRAKTMIARTEKEEALKADAYRSALNEANDCTVQALSIACGISYEEAHKRMADKGRRNGRGSTVYFMRQIARELGFAVETIDPKDFVAQYPASHQILKGVTSHHPERFNKVWKDGNTYLMTTRGHVLAVIDGVVHDWARGRALRVLDIYKIIPPSKSAQLKQGE